MRTDPNPKPDSLHNILCIDNESDILEIVKFALETIGNFKLEMCASGKEALERAASSHPDMILLDVMMPGMDGITVFKELRRIPALANVPIVFMTAKVRPAEVLRYQNMGAQGVISKPFDSMALPRVVESLWENRPESGRNAEAV